MDKDALFERHLDEEDVPLPRGGSVRVRALTRDEALKVSDKEMSRKRMEQIILAKAMVDPVMTEDEIGKWQRASAAGEIQKVADVVQRLSGMVEGAAKSDVSADGDD